MCFCLEKPVRRFFLWDSALTGWLVLIITEPSHIHSFSRGEGIMIYALLLARFHTQSIPAPHSPPREMQIKTIMRYYFTPFKLAHITKTKNTSLGVDVVGMSTDSNLLENKN